MPSYTPPIRDTRFILDAVIGLQAHANLPGFANATPDVVDAVLEEGGRFVAEVLFPLNQVGDQQGCTRADDGSVTTPEGFKEAYAKFVESGWGTLSAPEAFGGQGMPHVVSTAFQEYMISANMAFAMYPGLSHGAIAALVVKGSPEQQAKYLPKMVSGEWGGTMNLTEPQCGTDLGLIRTKAEPQADGSYAITGTKIFISAGEHDLTDNIIHLVLAKTPGAPDSSKGISLFVVPKFLVNDDGSLGERNGVVCGSIEHKMGIHGNSTCLLNYDGATGWLVGEEMKGLAAMFIMMNAARLGVGLQGLGVGETAYQNAVIYANDRRQGRALTGAAEPGEKADTLFVHPDVRRMLMEAKAWTEGLRALCLWGALQNDLEHAAATEEERQLAGDLLGLLTPVIKGVGTDKGYEIATNAQQVYGGHGYIAEWGMEQYVRDARIAMIYEGTNGVQAMDLVGRKLASNGGRAAQAFFRIVAEECASAKGDERVAGLATALEKALGELQAATMWFMANGMQNPNNVGAGAYSYMNLMGLVSVGMMWLRMAEAARKGLAAGEGDAAFLEAKLVTARFFAERILPDAGALRRKIEGGADAIMALPPEMFAAA
ncbi:acyl-CoA dehydrogenase C-terminal domain-containing protein [Sphingomonas donggukensis]|uniref:Acyl-CoA dehydrogenase C-terminal domain-containing protein n=1 Tax=Sphingomonas donggukensis TaxID=2949093 RepID=A0ABY4TY88_9SPHN|nr:acyl-CoA dehydrogenase C-terminal domain-containing protein [Sphingomonas donggukensis]URW76840.1 acyl-CoA dehydrogenase C-terminal domain-containing protein [Sphingomonas donggukensis]